MKEIFDDKIINNNFSRLEIKLNTGNGLFDARGESIKQKAHDYFGIESDFVHSVRVLTVDKDLSGEVKREFQKIVTDPVTEISSFYPLSFWDWRFYPFIPPA